MLSVTECRVTLVPDPDPHPPRLVAGVDLVVGDDLAIHGVKVVELPGGTHIVAMPSQPQRREDPCRCGHRPRVNDRCCPHCGAALPRLPWADRRHRDLVHPIRPGVRAALHAAVLDAYHAALEVAEIGGAA